MRKEPFLVLLGVLPFVSLFLCAEELPPPIQTIIVPFESEKEIVLCDPEIALKFSFEIVEYPSHGSLEGRPPTLIYKPNPGFYGDDSFRVLVYDAKTEELLEEIYVEVVVLGPGSLISPPRFSWNTDFTFSGPGFVLESSSVEGTLQLKFYYFDVEMRAKIDDGVFSSFRTTARYNLELPLGEAQIKIPVTLTTNFDPSVPKLDSWTAGLKSSILGFTFGYQFYFDADNPENSYGIFNLAGAIDEVSFSMRVKFQGLAIEFNEFDLTLRGKAFALGCKSCDFSWDAGLGFSKEEGFQDFYFTFRDFPLPCGVCGPIKLYASVKATFSVDAKDITPSIRVSAPWIDGCIRPRVALETPEERFGLEGIYVYGIEIKCEFANEISGKFVTSFDPEKDSSVTGDPNFFEYWRFEGPILGCCGDAGRWQITLFFSRDKGYLFGLSKYASIVYVPIFRGFLAHFGLELGLVDPSDPTKTWMLSFGWKGRF